MGVLLSNLNRKVSSNTLLSPECHIAIPIIFMQYLRLHTGGAGENSAEFASTCVHIAVELPTSSKLMLQLYVALSSTEFPLNVTIPLIGSTGSGHSAVKKINVYKLQLHTFEYKH